MHLDSDGTIGEMPSPIHRPPQRPLWLDVLAKHGVATVIALVLVWQLATRLDAQVREIREIVGGHALLLQAICINTAKTDVERMTCERAGKAR